MTEEDLEEMAACHAASNIFGELWNKKVSDGAEAEELKKLISRFPSFFLLNILYQTVQEDSYHDCLTEIVEKTKYLLEKISMLEKTNGNVH